MIRVLVVDDSAVVRDFLVYIFGSAPGMQVVGVAKDGVEAVEAAVHLKPDVITMDIHMPNMDGFEATRRIMETNAVPIVIVTGSSSVREMATAFHALEAGAIAVVSRPKGIADTDFDTTARDLVQTVKLMSEVAVVRRWPREANKMISTAVSGMTRAASSEIEAVAIGSSTGGPVVIQSILSRLPKRFSTPILIVQHIASGFITGFVEWLAGSSALPVRIAENNELALPGNVYLAPDGFHMGIDARGRILLSDDKPVNGLRPSVSFLFRSMANAFGNKAVGVLLTGMGRDGAQELKLMRERGAVTIVQDEDSSVIYGMPGEAVKLGAAMYVLTPERIADTLIDMVLGSKKDQ